MDVKQERMSDGEEEGDYLLAVEISCGESNVKLEEHNKEGSSDITCRICDRIFPNYAQLKTHQTLKHFSKGQEQSSYNSDLKQAKVGPFKCEVCMKAFPTRFQLVKHMEVHNKPYSCGICNEQMSSDLKCVEHMVLHFLEGVFDCDTCEKQFDDLKHHIFLHLLGEAYQCAICKKKFKQRSDLDAHTKKSHKFACGVCNRDFIDDEYLQEHVQTQHGGKPNDKTIHAEMKVFNVEFVDNDDDSATDEKPLKKLKVKKCRQSDTPDSGNEEDPLSGSQSILRIKSRASHRIPDRCYKCDTCGKTFPTSGNLHRHIRIHTGVRPYKCSVCGKDFSDASNLRTHRAKYHSKDVKDEILDGRDLEGATRSKRLKKDVNSVKKTPVQYKCEVCPKTYCTKGNLRRHNRIHTGERPYKCDVCGKDFYDPTNWKAHMRNNPGEHTLKITIKTNNFSNPKVKRPKRKRMECDICGERFTRKSILIEHIKNHDGEVQLKCEMCNKGFASTKKLAAHLLTHAQDARPFKCEICTAEFSLDAYLQRHVEKFHVAGEAIQQRAKSFRKKRIQCVLCNSEFGNYSCYVLHIRTHTGEKPFVCDICGKSYCSSSNLGIHMRVHTGVRPYKCAECNRDFSNQTSYNRHRKQHTGERDYECQICHKQFIQRVQLVSHMMQHTGERPYKCESCDKSYSHRSMLNEHVKTHITERPFRCEICGNEYRARKGLTTHIRKNHTLPAKY